MIVAVLAGSPSTAPAVASDGALDADQAAGPAVAWRVPLATDGASSPLYASGRLFVGTADGLAGLDPETGGIIINYRTAPVVTTPAAIRGFDPQPDPPGKWTSSTRTHDCRRPTASRWPSAAKAPTTRRSQPSWASNPRPSRRCCASQRPS
jgi:outer membrane protein assembly factor BamB